MTLTRQEIEQLRSAAMPLMLWIANNCHPHCKAIVDSEHLELLEGIASHFRNPVDYSRDNRYFALEQAAKDFVAKVERGEARSHASYKQFKDALLIKV